MYVYLCTYRYISMYINACIYVMSACFLMHIDVYVCYECTYVLIYVYARVLDVCIHKYVYMHIHTQI